MANTGNVSPQVLPYMEGVQGQQTTPNPVTGQVLGKGIMPPQASTNYGVTPEQFTGQNKPRPEVLAYYRNNIGGQQGSQNPTTPQDAGRGGGQRSEPSDKAKHMKAVRMARTRIETTSRENRDKQKEAGQSRTPAS